MITEQLRQIFESSGSLRRIHLPQEYDLLATCIKSEMIHLESAKLAATKDGLQAQLNHFLKKERWDEIEIARLIPQLANITNGGGNTHNMICRCAASWLLDKNYKIIAEQRINGRRVDLLSTCYTWIIECGDTSPGPIAKHLLSGVQQVGIIPFQPYAPFDLEMFVFSKGAAWNEHTIRSNLLIDFSN